MSIQILIPALSPTMTEQLSGMVKKGQCRFWGGSCRNRTDEATMEVEAVDEGVLGKILVPSGTEGVSINAL